MDGRRISQDRLAGYLKLRHFETEETVSTRDEIGPEILKTYEKLGIRLPMVTMHECMEPRVIARSPPPALSPLTPVSQVSVHPDIRNCSCDFAQAKVQAVPADDDRNFLTGEFEKLLTEKTRLVAITQMLKRPARSFCSR